MEIENLRDQAQDTLKQAKKEDEDYKKKVMGSINRAGRRNSKGCS